MNPFTAARDLLSGLLSIPVEELILRLTLLTLLLHGSSETSLDVPLQVLCGMMLMSRNHYQSPGLWIAVTVFIWSINASDWLWIDNHKYLMSYWVLACTLAVSALHPLEILRWNARLLIGLCFAFATLWKLMAGQYWNGEFLTYTLLADSRMEFLANVLGGVSEADLAQVRTLENTISLLPDEMLRASIEVSPRLQALALAMSYWTLLIEGIIAGFYLYESRFSRRWRDSALLVFIASTYFFVPVLGFGYILVILGLVTCEGKPKTRATYLGVLVILQLGRLPWDRLFG